MISPRPSESALDIRAVLSSPWPIAGRLSFCGTAAEVGSETLAPGERAAVVGAGRKRTLEFSAGRWCARQALAALGRENSVIPVGAGREPVWPAGITGSISHTEGYACVLVSDFGAALGIDVERIGGAGGDDIWNMVMDQEEERLCRDDTERLVVFSAKESLYKALFGFVGAYFGFRAAAFRSTWDGSFELTIRKELGERVPCAARFAGSYAVWNGLVFTELVLEPQSRGFQAGRRYGLPLPHAPFPSGTKSSQSPRLDCSQAFR